MTHIWYWRKRLPERKGQRCRVLARGALNSILVEFHDGFRVVTSRYAVRKLAALPIRQANLDRLRERASNGEALFHDGGEQ